MAKEEKSFKISGLHTYADVFSAVPEGSLSTAENVVIDQNNLLSPRRGYEGLTTDTSTGGTLTFGSNGTLFSFKGKVHYQTGSGTLYYYDPDNLWWVAYSDTVTKPSSANRSRIVAANQNVYITSSNGVQKISSLGSSITDAGAPQALSPALQSENTSGSTIDENHQVAYRVLWGYKDTNSNLILGAPSQRLVLTSTAGTEGVDYSDFTLRLPIPSSVTTNWFYQVYRSEKVDQDGGAVVPSDEMNLAFEGNPASGDITNGYVDYEDTTPDDLLGTPLYTNATQEGSVNANFEPPQCVDVALFQGHVFYANTTRKHEQIIQLLGTGTNGLQDGDTITVDGTVFTAKASPSAGTDFQLYNGGSPSGDVEDTAKALIKAINDNDLDVEAYYWSEVSSTSFDLPGEIRIVEKDFNLTGGFSISGTGTNVNTTWTPTISSGVNSEAEAKTNRVYYSKFQEPEAVPVANYFDVGPANSRILRILPLRTALLIFTEEAIYRLTGTTQSAFQTNLLDNTAQLLAEDSAVVFNNAVYGLFDQGVCQVSESVSVISRPIEGELLQARGIAGDYLQTLTYGIGYESDRKYIIYMPVTINDTTTASKAYVFNTVTRSWTSWERSFRHGVIHLANDKLFMLGSDKISRERKDFANQDITDEQIAATCTVVSDNVLTLNAGAIALARVGDYYSESDTRFSRIESIDVVTNQITVADTLTWGLSAKSETGDTTDTSYTLTNVTNTSDLRVGATISGSGIPANTKIVAVDSSLNTITLNRAATATATDVTLTITQTYDILPYIDVLVTWNPFYMGTPGILKHFSEATLISTSPVENVTVGFKGVSSAAFEDIEFNTNVLGAWGLFEWGNVVWGGDPTVLRYRTYIPAQKARDSALFARIRLGAIFNNFEISGFSVIYRVIGSRTRR
jgi:hypothetical protein